MIEASSRPSILITGAAGGLGSLLARKLSHSYSLSLLDSQPLSFRTTLPFHRQNLADRADLSACLAGVETIIHLAGEPTARVPWESLLASNVLATENLLREAHRLGGRRVLLASSVQVMEGYPPGANITPDLPVWPVNRYGVSKACAEIIAARFGRKAGMSVLCLRLGWVLPHFDWRITPWSPYLDLVLTESDFVRVVEGALERGIRAPFEIHHALSDNRRKRLNIDSARRVLGYFPQDDSYRIAGRNGPGMVMSAAHAMARRWKSLRRRPVPQEYSPYAAG
jgi:NAD(P)-dependent dehydrogenase (short-subunit alcohol dehydrogenase family)